MSAIEIFNNRASVSGALARVSLSDGVVTLGPALQDDLESLFVWLNDAHSAKLDLPHRPVDCVAFQQWLDRLPQETSQVLFAIRRMGVEKAIGFVTFRNFQAV